MPVLVHAQNEKVILEFKEDMKNKFKIHKCSVKWWADTAGDFIFYLFYEIMNL